MTLPLMIAFPASLYSQTPPSAANDMQQYRTQVTTPESSQIPDISQQTAADAPSDSTYELGNNLKMTPVSGNQTAPEPPGEPLSIGNVVPIATGEANEGEVNFENLEIAPDLAEDFPPDIPMTKVINAGILAGDSYDLNLATEFGVSGGRFTGFTMDNTGNPVPDVFIGVPDPNSIQLGLLGATGSWLAFTSTEAMAGKVIDIHINYDAPDGTLQTYLIQLHIVGKQTLREKGAEIFDALLRDLPLSGLGILNNHTVNELTSDFNALYGDVVEEAISYYGDYKILLDLEPVEKDLPEMWIYLTEGIGTPWEPGAVREAEAILVFYGLLEAGELIKDLTMQEFDEMMEELDEITEKADADFSNSAAIIDQITELPQTSGISTPNDADVAWRHDDSATRDKYYHWLQEIIEGDIDAFLELYMKFFVADLPASLTTASTPPSTTPSPGPGPIPSPTPPGIPTAP